LHPFRPIYGFNYGIPMKNNFGIVPSPVLEDRSRPQSIATMDNVYLTGKASKNSASSTAESPPPTTATFLSRKKAPSQVAQ